MNWLTENSMWVLFGLILFTLVWLVWFFMRNNQAKSDQGSGLPDDTKNSGATPIKKSDKV